MSTKCKKPTFSPALRLGISGASLSDRTRVKRVITLNRLVSFTVELFPVCCGVYYESQKYK